MTLSVELNATGAPLVDPTAAVGQKADSWMGFRGKGKGPPSEAAVVAGLQASSSSPQPQLRAFSDDRHLAEL
eukprot:4995176-Pyramimonas_sp.AAC.2